MHETLQNVSSVLAVFSVHIGDEEQCGITQHIYYLLDIYWISTHGIVRVSTKCYLKARATLALLCPVQFSFLSAVFPVLAVERVAGRPRPYLEIFVHKSGLLHYRSTPPAPATATSTNTLREHYFGIMVVEKSRI